MITVPILFVLIKLHAKKIRPKYKKYKKMQSGLFKIVQEVLTATRIVQTFGMEEQEQERFTDNSGEVIKERIWLSGAESFFGLSINLTTALKDL